MIAVSPAPSLFCFAASTITEPLDLARGGVASWPATGGVGANGSAIHADWHRNTCKAARARKVKLQRTSMIQRDRRDGRIVQNIVEDYRAGRAGKGMLSSHRLVQHGAKREQVAARIQLFAARLLRRHVRDGANSRPGTGQHVRGIANSRAAETFVVAVQQLGQTEIENLGGAALGHENVGRLDVSMHDALFMRGTERVAELYANLQNARRRQRGVPHPLSETT